MYRGSCLCGAVSFRLRSEPKAVSNCHCRMCQKQHGAAFATYASLPRSDLEYLSGQELLTSYNSSGSIDRKFCSVCGSNIEWSGSEKFPGWVSIVIASLDTYFEPRSTKDINLESRACWLANHSFNPDALEPSP
ncbi:GFA family protein [Stutzerimonas stutzeri]|uniref:GFA family protein n=1 Tax=Stutzerimonas stutzeri TaxID=316 RepID=UPI0015E3F374|nr:GFA family protein [Stutzerimonas stutzeri]MBA1263498.1 GFA family protein [Stutzerimonas stutzeri]